MRIKRIVGIVAIVAVLGGAVACGAYLDLGSRMARGLSLLSAGHATGFDGGRGEGFDGGQGRGAEFSGAFRDKEGNLRAERHQGAAPNGFDARSLATVGAYGLVLAGAAVATHLASLALGAFVRRRGGDFPKGRLAG